MRRIIVAIITALFLATPLVVVFSQIATAHTETDPFVTDLIAGQTIDAGDVSVWNDGTHLFVRFETTGDWAIRSTHLHVATALEDIPQTKKGLPKQGRFDYNTPHDPPVAEYDVGGLVAAGDGEELDQFHRVPPGEPANARFLACEPMILQTP